MQKQILLFLSILLIMALNIGCIGAPVESQTDTPLLTSEFVLAKEQVYQDIDGGFTLDYPADWHISGDRLIWLDPSEVDFKSSSNSFFDRKPFMFHATNPYVGLDSEAYHVPSPSASVAKEVLGTLRETNVLEPIKSVNINGRDGATFLVEQPMDISPWNMHQYVIILRISEHTTIQMLALGPANRSQEMKDILNAIALNFRPLDE